MSENTEDKNSRSQTRESQGRKSKKGKYSRSPKRKDRKHYYSRSRSRSSSYHDKKSRRSKKNRSRSRSYSPQQKSKRMSKFTSQPGQQQQNQNGGINSERQQLISNLNSTPIQTPQQYGVQSMVQQQQLQPQPSPLTIGNLGGGLRQQGTTGVQPIIGQMPVMSMHQPPQMGPNGALLVPQQDHKHYKHALRIYCGNIPDHIDQQSIEIFVADSLRLCGGCLDPGNPIFSGLFNEQKKFIFLQMRSIEEATALFQLDGIMFQGKPLRLRRPNNFEQMQKVEGLRPIPKLDMTKIQIQKIATQVENTPDKIWIQNIPENYSDQQVIDILQQYGQLKSFHLAADKVTNISKGFAFCEFYNKQQADGAIQRLNGQQIGNKQLLIKYSQNLQDVNGGQQQVLESMVQQFMQGYKDSIRNEKEYLLQQELQKEQQQELIENQSQYSTIYDYSELTENNLSLKEKISAIIKISSIIDPNLIEKNDKEYEYIFNDIKKQFELVGPINQVIIPRVKDGFEETGIGKVYIEYLQENHAQIAKFCLKDIQYQNKELKIEFYDPRKFADQIYL